MFGQLTMGNGTSFLFNMLLMSYKKMLLSIPCVPTLKVAENSFMSGTVAGIMMGPPGRREEGVQDHSETQIVNCRDAAVNSNCSTATDNQRLTSYLRQKISSTQ